LNLILIKMGKNHVINFFYLITSYLTSIVFTHGTILVVFRLEKFVKIYRLLHLNFGGLGE